LSLSNVGTKKQARRPQKRCISKKQIQN